MIDRFLGLAMLLLLAPSAAEAAEPQVEFQKQPGQVAIVVAGKPFATFRYEDERIFRPFFAHVRTPSGVQVTRNHPPIAGKDLTDHDTFHPGIWLSFGDINGSDYWRGAARVKFVEFAEEPTSGKNSGSFAVRSQYLDQQQPDQVVCEEEARYTVVPRPEGIYLLWDSTFSSDDQFAFGDQEEMGLGFRVATPIRVDKKTDDSVPAGNGTMIDSEGRKNGDQIWGNTAEWCDYSGTLDGQRVGMTLFCHPDNFRPSWFHARDYGLLEANPFGREAFGKGPKSTVVVEPGEKFRLRYGLLVHSGPEGSESDHAATYREYLDLTGK